LCHGHGRHYARFQRTELLLAAGGIGLQMPNDNPIVIIGSGAAGGMAAYVLTKLGIKCVMLEAGPLLDLDRHRVLKPVSELPYRGFGRPGQFPHVVQASEFDANLWADEKQNPYPYDPGDQYNWVR